MKHNGIWGTVCADNFGDTEADVLCRSLGFRFDILLLMDNETDVFCTFLAFKKRNNNSRVQHTTLLQYVCNKVKNSNHQCCGRESNPGRLRNRPTLYHVILKACLYRKAVYLSLLDISHPFKDSFANLI